MPVELEPIEVRDKHGKIIILHPVLLRGKPALYGKEAAAYSGLSAQGFIKRLDILEKQASEGVPGIRSVERQTVPGAKKVYFLIEDLDYMRGGA